MTGSPNAFPGTAPPAGAVRKLTYRLELLKLHLCLYVGLSGVFGHAMARQAVSVDSLVAGGLIFILACGAAVLNNIQDMDYDRLFERTSNRALPKKRVPVGHAAVMSAVMTGCGLSGLLVFTGFRPFLAGLAALVCYNGLYTPLKKRFFAAIIPGTLCGMLVPLIGWTAAGRPLSDPMILMIMLVLGLWQIPHFFMILLNTRPYKGRLPETRPSGAAPVPWAARLFPQREIKLQVLIWTSLYSLAILLLLINGLFHSRFLEILSGLNAFAALLLISVAVLKKQDSRFAFAVINLSLLLFMGAGVWDKL